MTQCDDVLQYMRDHGSITPLQAMAQLNIYRLAARISDLIDRGYRIRSERVRFRNQYGRQGHYARYSLEE